MSTLRQQLKEAAERHETRQRELLSLIRSGKPPCVFAEEVGRTKCCSVSYRCLNSESKQYGGLGTVRRCARCSDRASFASDEIAEAGASTA